MKVEFDPQREVSRENRAFRAAAEAFYSACRGNDVDALLEATDGLAQTMDGWAVAMRKIAKLRGVANEIRKAFESVWIQHKALPQKIGSRAAAAAGLRVLLRREPAVTPIIVFRGAMAREKQTRGYGFSWTTDRDVARRFAESRRGYAGAVIFETFAPPDAILWARTAENFYDEGEVVVDPYKLRRVRAIERLAPTATLPEVTISKRAKVATMSTNPTRRKR